MKKLGKRLKQYSALAATVVAADASGQVVYTNLTNVVLTNDGDFFDIDLNSDGNAEVRIKIAKSSFFSSYSSASVSYNVNSIYVQPMRNSVEIASTQSSFSIYSALDTIPVVKAFPFNTVLNNTLNWQNDTILAGGYLNLFYNIGYSSMTISASPGQFPGAGDKYMAIKFDLNNNTHYGWVRLDVAAKSNSVTIKDFAYESQANTPISAGNTGVPVGLSKSIFSQAKIYAVGNQIKIEGNIPAKTEVRLYDIQGKLINSEYIQSGSKTLQAQITAKGIYIVELRNGKTAFRKKLWLEEK